MRVINKHSHFFLLSVAVIIWGVLYLPPVRVLLESSLIGHLLIQIPLLVFSGVLLTAGMGDGFKKQLLSFNQYGFPFAILAVCTGLYWMIPRSMDNALDYEIYELVKFISLPLLLGACLRLVWTELVFVVKGVIIAHFISMLVFLGWLYYTSPIRICNNYLADQQKYLGIILLLIALFLSIYFVARGFFTKPSYFLNSHR